jgi:hypothetical protein
LGMLPKGICFYKKCPLSVPQAQINPTNVSIALYLPVIQKHEKNVSFFSPKMELSEERELKELHWCSVNHYMVHVLAIRARQSGPWHWLRSPRLSGSKLIHYAPRT